MAIAATTRRYPNCDVHLLGVRLYLTLQLLHGVGLGLMRQESQRITLLKLLTGLSQFFH
jgi:hypothetical protein